MHDDVIREVEQFLYREPASWASGSSLIVRPVGGHPSAGSGAPVGATPTTTRIFDVGPRRLAMLY
jgi:hypothetical protein